MGIKVWAVAGNGSEGCAHFRSKKSRLGPALQVGLIIVNPTVFIIFLNTKGWTAFNEYFKKLG